MNKADIQRLLADRILLLDGAMGTVIAQYGYSGNNDMLCLTHPEVIADIHRRYLEAGADIISTNTFNAQRISQADYGTQDRVYDINREGARLARAQADRYTTADKPRLVAGSMGPTNKTASMSPDVSDTARRDVTFDQLLEAYREQVAGLIDGGADLLLIETIFDTLNAKAALCAVEEVMTERQRRLPVMLSVTISDNAGRTLSGQTLEAFLASVSTADVLSVGLNCSFGPRQMIPYLERLARSTDLYISAHPNAGLPNALGLYDETPATMTPQMAMMVDSGLVNIMGGCCGTTPDYIAAFAKMAQGKKPRRPVCPERCLTLSGLEPLRIDGSQKGITGVGERCNVAGSRKFLRLIKEGNYDEAVTIARQQVADGAQVIDINMDDALLDAKTSMTTFLRMIAAEPDIARVSVMIDSSDWDVIEAGLKCVQGKSIVNSISLKEGEEKFLQHARSAHRLGAAVVVMCFDEEGQATTYERRVEIAQRSFRLLTEIAGLPPEDIIFDPNILAIATGMDEHNSQAADFIRATAWIRENLKGAHVSGGVSNLSFSFRGNNKLRQQMHTVFLHHAEKAGMDFAIVNPAQKLRYDDIPKEERDIVERAILNTSPEAAQQLIALAAQQQQATATSAKPSAADNTPHPTAATQQTVSVEQRIMDVMTKGDSDNLTEILTEALQRYPSAVDIIEQPLMDAMNEVGRRFGRGEMFLPQVVKTARIMKQAVDFLQPYIEAEQSTQQCKRQGKVLLATVKGDVHDIGKNIVGVVMACNGYEVIDLGVMTPAETIVRKAKEEQVDIIGLSGLITPSLEEMVNVARLLQQEHIDIPIMIGGATTSELHVALKIAPVYHAAVTWVKDASQNPRIAAQLMQHREEYSRELDTKYAAMRDEYYQQNSDKADTVDIEQARRQKKNFFDSKEA